LSSLLQSKVGYFESTAHIELINLNARQIYTTNYDEIIEQTFRALGHPYSLVALPKHIAVAQPDKTQIVKYHGDLRFDHSLVLTESSYYSRLEFESPMDLKFRSDLLGQSVLFIGYSFRDINIRIIWFKLMEMMRDVPENDRPSSYIVRFERNEVLEDLYRAVGIKTIYLDPEGAAKTNEDRNRILGRFMLDLSLRISPDALMPHSSLAMYVSSGLLNSIRDLSATRRGVRSSPRDTEFAKAYIDHASRRRVSPEMRSKVDELIGNVAASSRFSILNDIVGWAMSFLQKYGPGLNGSRFAILRGLLVGDAREAILASKDDIDWEDIYGLVLPVAAADVFIKALQSEIEHNREYVADADIAYAADVVMRIRDGIIAIDGGLSPEMVVAMNSSLGQAIELYSAIAEIKPKRDSLTDLSGVVAQINGAHEVDEEDDIPF
jgi:hypothetical protein